MAQSPVAWRHALRIWWAAAWRATLVGAPVSFVAAIVLGRLSQDAPVWVGYAISGLLVLLPGAISLWALWFALSKRYGSFEVTIRPR